MLFGYPIAATHDNWWHECLLDTIRSLHACVDAGRPYPTWPNIIPTLHQASLESKTGLRDKLAAYYRVVRRFSKVNRDAVLQTMESQNCIPDLLSCVCDCPTFEDLPKSVRSSIKALFDYAYERLPELGLRDAHYKRIYDHIPAYVCPFCGTEPFEAPGLTREELDHYLPKSLYPFAAANLRNLVPMGHKCNANYKRTTDLLRHVDKTRRQVIDPYCHTAIVVSLINSDPFGGDHPMTPRWIIDFEPCTPAVATWDEVFKVRDRYQRSHLDRDYRSWLEQFSSYVIQSGLSADTDDDLIAALRNHEAIVGIAGWSDRAFLKVAVFRMLRYRCENGDQRLLKVIKDLVTPSAALTAMAS